MARQARMVGCQSKSQGTRYCLGLIVYDIVVVKIFDRYSNIGLSIRALVALETQLCASLRYPYIVFYCIIKIFDVSRYCFCGL